MNKEYKWTLETGSKKYPCPGCQKKTFVRYVFADTRQHVGEQFGRCDRENNCGYHRAPEKDVEFPPHPPTKRKLPPPTVITPDEEYMQGIKNKQATNFHDFAKGKLGITAEHLQAWGVGTKWKFTAFLSTTKDQRTVNAKFVAYTSEGKRNKETGTDGTPKFIPHYLGKAYLRNMKVETDNARLEDWQDYYKFERCFYGEHLFDTKRDTCLVESEKTAVLAAFFFPNYNWLATGGNNGMTFDHFKLFYGYTGRIWNLVDNDQAGIKKSKTVAWLDKLAEMRDNKEKILSVNLFEKKPAGWDLADAIIFDKYRDPAQFEKDLNEAIDCRQQYDIDMESGEVRIKPKYESKAWKLDEKELKRARQVANRIFEEQVDIIAPDLHCKQRLMIAFTSFREDGLPLAIKVFGQHPGESEESIENFFHLVLKNTPGDDAKDFFKVAKAAGVETRYVKTARSEAAEGAEGIDAHEWKITWPDDLEHQDHFNEYEYREQTFSYSYIEHKNCIWYATFNNKDREIGFYKISNFVIRPLYLIKSKTDPKRLFEIKNIFGVKYIMDIPTKALVSLTEFQVFCESNGNFLFEGSKQQFTKIKRKLYDETKDAEEVKMLGWQDEGFYAFANGSYNSRFSKVDQYGIIKHLVEKSAEEAEEKYFFIPAMSSIYKDEKDQYDLEKKFVFIPRPEVKFSDWAQLFHDVYGENGVVGLSFYISSLFRDMIYSRFKFFPHLFHFGPPGTGKSTMCWSIQYMFGLERKPFMLNAGTAVGFHRTFAQFRNAVVWFDEYNNTIEYKRVQDLKSAYDGAGHVKGEWSASGGTSNKTTTTPVESACNISGQELPIADNALFKRCILLQYYKTIFSDEEKMRLTDLQKLQEKGLSHITGALMRFREKMEKEYFQVFDQVEKEIMEALEHDETIESRIIKNMAVVATTFKVLEHELPWPWNWPKMKEVIVKNIKSQNGLISNAKETNQFWDAVDYCISEGELKDGEDFKVEYCSSIKITVDRKPVERNLVPPQKVLFIRIATAHPKYMEALRKQGEKKGMDKGSLAHYLSHSPGFLGMVGSTRFKKGEKSFTSNAYAFEYKGLEDQGYNFDRFDEEEAEKEETEKKEMAVKFGDDQEVNF
ncbi:hypothetical protein DN752_20980 [Echinicola strongylocentroti]|uniref:DUF927 domain-containing protein n=1 Tax=Echinicola strongylocentroti TaxID=1795355 RepID=A0A2Z4INQ7_9BACT|nr:DUF6371 domain-containing protein [Echinicola strongylocentroti]AWW32417.1 hypothetical protein DN752_20980 [Echinicola strongylocentroti]